MARSTPPDLPNLPHRRARLFRNGSNQAVRIPREYELRGEEVLMYRDGDRLILESWPPRAGLLQLLDRLEPIEDVFPDVDDALQPLDDVRL